MTQKSETTTTCPSCGCIQGAEHKSGCVIYKEISMAYADHDTGPQSVDEFLLATAPQNEDLP